MNRYVPCPCGSKRFYAKCCQPYHLEKSRPENAETLMRSRFTAYAMGIPDYIIKTTHPDNHSYTTKVDEWKASIMQFCDATIFHELHVLEFEDGADKAYVTFKAVLSQAQKDATFTERSAFVTENGRWLYLSGEIKNGNLS